MKGIIKSITVLNRLRNGEHIEFHRTVVHYMKDRVMKFPLLYSYWNIYLQVFELEEKIYRQSLKNAKASDVLSANKKRYLAFLALKRKLSFVHNRREKTELKLAIKVFNTLLRTYKDIAAASDLERTQLIDRLVYEMKQPVYADQLSLLDLTAEIELLSATNVEFDKKYREFYADFTMESSLGNMKYIRPQLDKGYHNLNKDIYALYRLNELGEQDPQIRKDLLEVIHFLNATGRTFEDAFEHRSAVPATT